MLAQDYSSYSSEDHRTWATLFNRQNKLILEKASEEFQKGFARLSLDPFHVADLAKVNEKLAEVSGWSLVAASGLVPNRDFFGLLRDKKFPVTVSMRKPHEIEFSELPDIFHDVYGHTPMLMNRLFCDFMSEYARVALKYIDDQTIIAYFGRLYWFTLEMGLIREEGRLKPYGGAILTSSKEIENIRELSVKKYPFDMQWIIHTEYDNLKLQKEYFVLDSYQQLFDSLGEMDRHLERGYRKRALVSV